MTTPIATAIHRTAFAITLAAGTLAHAQSFPLPPAPAGVEVTRSEGIEFVTITPPPVGTGGYNPIAGPGSDGRTNFGTVTQPYRIARTELTSDTFLDFFNAMGQMPQDSPALQRLIEIGGSGATLDWQGLPDQSFPGPGYRWYLPEPERDRRIPLLGISWRLSAVLCNWLHNGRTTNPNDLLTGAYDVSTFGSNPDGTFADQLTRSPGARFWIPSLDEWLTAAHFDPNRNGQGQGGWYQYPTSSDAAPVRGLPGTPGAETSAGLNVSNTFGVAAYPTVQSPWGLLDASGGGSEWTETVPLPFSPFPGIPPVEGRRTRFVEGTSITFGGSNFENADTLLFSSGSGPDIAQFQQTLRIAAAIPSPSAAVVTAVVAIGLRCRRTRRSHTTRKSLQAV